VVPLPLKGLFVPGSIPFFLFMLLPGVCLMFRRKDGGRIGRIWVAALVLSYWALSTPIAAIAFVKVVSPDYPPVMSSADAPGATAVVVLGAGMEIHRSRGTAWGVPTREGWLRVMEAARVSRVLGGLPIVTTGAHGSEEYTEAGLMAHQLQELGVPADRIIKEDHARNTRDHALLVPPVLKAHGLGSFVLVTSRQHMRRSLAAFRVAGTDPVPSTPEAYVSRGAPLEMYLPSLVALQLSERVLYDLFGLIYYKVRGWA
jgi:uncharacterized SAM-binding protein YcdF (DUF218 family)